MPKIRWTNLPVALRDHLFERPESAKSPWKTCTS